MKRHSGFARGTGCYKCESCGRQTRQTPTNAGSDWKVCDDCFELAGYQNGISDNGPANNEGDYLAYAREHARTICAKGGVLDWSEAFWAEVRCLDEIHALALAEHLARGFGECEE